MGRTVATCIVFIIPVWVFGELGGVLDGVSTLFHGAGVVCRMSLFICCVQIIGAAMTSTIFTKVLKLGMYDLLRRALQAADLEYLCYRYSTLWRTMEKGAWA